MLSQRKGNEKKNKKTSMHGTSGTTANHAVIFCYTPCKLGRG
jgi:hypothetical protein